ncbi:MAG: glycerol-3-phosphate 1-O-acyltransferase PlsY [Angelakisella sp.]
MRLFLAACMGYLLGSITFGIIMSRTLHKDDIRRHGSGNAGTTNALRTYGGRTAILVLAGDFLKGTLAVLLGGLIAGGDRRGALLAALFVVVGHLFPIFFGFRGGKGVATAAGAILMLNPMVLVILLIPFLLIIIFTRYMSLAAITVAVLFPIVTAVYMWLGGPITAGGYFELAVSAVIGALVVFMHRANIGRLLKGTESKLGKKKA